MQYAILCYHDEKVVWSWSKAEDDAVMARLMTVHERLVSSGTMGPAARLLPTTSATTLRKSAELVIDGPFAETKEQLLGFYLVDVPDLEGAMAVVRDLAEANPGAVYELRPVALYVPDKRSTVAE